MGWVYPEIELFPGTDVEKLEAPGIFVPYIPLQTSYIDWSTLVDQDQKALLRLEDDGGR